MVKASALKKRYILCEVKFASNESTGENELKRGIYNEALKFFGEYLLSFVALKFVEYDVDKKNALLRCNRDFYGEVLGFLALINQLNGKKARVIAKKASGTIKGLSAGQKNADTSLLQSDKIQSTSEKDVDAHCFQLKTIVPIVARRDNQEV